MLKDRYNKRIKITSEILNKIAKIDRFQGFWQGSMNLSPQILGRLKKSVIITSTGASTRIEGAKMKDEEIGRLLQGLKSKSPKNRDEEEVAGYADLLGRIFDNYKTLKLTEGQILQFHSILLEFSKKDKDHRGVYKKKDNIVVARDEKGKEKILFRPTPPYLVKKEMDDILFWTNERLEKKDVHPIIVICNFVFEFLAIHPFIDGNGRLSRALTILLLLKTGNSYVSYVSLEEIIEEDQTEYYLSLRETQKKHKTNDEDITPWVDFMLKILLKQTERIGKILENIQPEKTFSKNQSLIFNHFNDTALSISDIEKKLKNKILRSTLRQVIGRLEEMKLIERIGQGRGTRYIKSEI